MPLHLLGKKSWNVYNTDNVARVRRDEAQAQAREEEEERRMQEVDAERRISILRGEHPSGTPTIPISDDPASSRHSSGRERKRRRTAGEDDTDRDIRHALEDAERGPKQDNVLRKPSSDAPLTDHTGHINLFPPARSQRSEKNPEAEAEAAKKKREYEDQYTMRFSNAAGFKQRLEDPWYSTTKPGSAQVEAVGRDVWGNEDPRRQERERLRIDANDPLAAMKMGVTQLRRVEQDRKKWNDERHKELEAVKAARQDEHHKKRRRGRDGDDDEIDLEDFSLDTEPAEEDRRRHRPQKHRHRSRSRENRHRHSERRRHRKSPVREDTRRRNAETGWAKAPGKRYSAQFATA